LQADPAFLDPSVAQRTQNLYPSRSFILERRKGSAAFLSVASTAGVPIMRRFTVGGVRYIYLVQDRTGGGNLDRVMVSTNEGAFGAVGGTPNFTTENALTYDMVRWRDRLYVANGTDPLKIVTIGGTASDLNDLTTTSITGIGVAFANETTSSLPNGTYSYAWAVYDTVLKQWISRSVRLSFNLSGTTRQRVTFTSPSTALGANELYHLFVAPVGLSLEFAHDQVPGGIAAATTQVLLDVTVEGAQVPIPGVTRRTGKYLARHRQRLFAAGQTSDPRKVFATGLLLPGREQEFFDIGEFWPANALVHLDNDVSGIGVVGTTGQDDPRAPLAMFTQTETVLLLGDIIDDPSAELVWLSDEVGCSSHHSIRQTAVGLVFMGVESVYALTLSGQLIDVGWPIRPVIAGIPLARRPNVIAEYHDGFYKLHLTPPGAVTNTQQWWLDLRRGLGTGIPSWWGPHSMPAFDAIAAGVELSGGTLPRRFFGAKADGAVLELDQGFADEGAAYTVSLLTGFVDGGVPFDRKLGTRIRAIVEAEQGASIGAAIQLEGSALVTLGSMDYDEDLPASATWNVSEWNTAMFGSLTFREAQALTDTDRPRGRTFAAQLEHTQAANLRIRDVELTGIGIARPTRTERAS